MILELLWAAVWLTLLWKGLRALSRAKKRKDERRLRLKRFRAWKGTQVRVERYLERVSR